MIQQHEAAEHLEHNVDCTTDERVGFAVLQAMNICEVSIDTHLANVLSDSRHKAVVKGLHKRDDRVLLLVSQVQVA